MQFRQLIVAASLFFSGAAFGSSPIFTSCPVDSSGSRSTCSEQEYISFLKRGESEIRSALGLIVTDSVFVKYKIRKNGSISIKSSYSNISEDLRRNCENWVKQLDGKVTGRAEVTEYSAIFNFDIPGFNAIDINESEFSPTLLNCVDLNGVGQRSCLEYIINRKVADLSMRAYEGRAEIDMYFSPQGKLVALDFVRPARNAKLNDSLIGRLRQITDYITINEKASQEHFSRYYSMRYVYSLFHTSTSERTYLERDADKLLESGDTLLFIKDVISTGLELKMYSSFIKHCDKYKERYNMTGSEYVESCMGKLEIDSLISISASFDERTDSILQVEDIPACPVECEAANSEFLCTSQYIQKYIIQQLESNYGIDMENMFCWNVLNSVGKIRGRVRITVDREGSIYRVAPFVFPYFEVGAGLAEPRYVMGREQYHMINLLLIEVLSTMPQFSPRKLNGNDCYDSFAISLELGKNRQ